MRAGEGASLPDTATATLSWDGLPASSLADHQLVNNQFCFESLRSSLGRTP
jgi:hypothetical protein